MAGLRHHEVPRFLMKGFASRIVPKTTKEDAVFVWMYRKGGEPFECNTINVGVETRFYDDGVQNVDPQLTELERTFAFSIKKVRELDDGSKILDPTVLEFIVNLTMRTKHLRDSVIEMGGFAADNILGYFSDYKNIQAYCVRLLTHRRDILMKAFDEDLKSVRASRLKKVLVRLIIRYIPAKLLIKLIDYNGAELAEAFESSRVQLTQRIDQIVKQAHIKSLLKDLVPEPRVEYYKQLHWYIRKSTEPLILGDVCCLFQVLNSRYVSIAGPSDGINKVYLPVSKNCIVVGSSENKVPDIDVAEINEASAKVSRKYFISSVRSPEMVRLTKLIGSEPDILTEEDMEKIMTEAIFESSGSRGGSSDQSRPQSG